MDLSRNLYRCPDPRVFTQHLGVMPRLLRLMRTQRTESPPRERVNSGVTTGVTLYRNLVRFGAIPCKEETHDKSLIRSCLFRVMLRGARRCKKADFWTQNPPEATPWGFDSPSRHQISKNYRRNNLSLREVIFVDGC
jgi:hypothetical protein